ncbi:MAG TPA: hypothetical protein VEC02_04770 [Nitrososphaerales archaeon]|nr:hypothetical protein [Nitrososphaerales archaeon]
MRVRTVVIGVIVLVIGVGLIGAGALEALRSVTISTTFTQPHPGEYVSSEIVLNTTSAIVVASPASAGGIIPAKDLSLVNSTNLGSYVLPVNSTAAGSDTYDGLVGDYYYVAFASAQPTATVVATPLNSSAIGFGLLVLLGILCFIVGIVVVIVGVVQKKRAPQGQQA